MFRRNVVVGFGFASHFSLLMLLWPEAVLAAPTPGQTEAPSPAQDRPVCDDGDPCNEDYWDDSTQDCVYTPIDCDDGNVCNGSETCEPGIGCVAGTPLSCDDGLFCNGTEHCDESLDQCYSDNIPCNIDQVCEEQSQECLDALIFSDGFESGSIGNWS